jgi:hypothetical protein
MMRCSWILVFGRIGIAYDEARRPNLQARGDGMKQAEVVAALFAGVGVVVIMAGAALTDSAPEMRDTIHGAGLVSMLIGAGIFLLARRRPQLTRNRYAPAGLQETSKNLAIAGATFLVASIAAGVALEFLLTSVGLAHWIFAALGLLGTAALLLGAAGYAIALLFEKPESGDRRGNSL